MSKKVRVKCRINQNIILPCNWVKDGYCGGDGKPCQIEQMKGTDS